MILAFGEWELDTELFELRQDGCACKMEPQVFDLLHLLLRHRDRIVSRDEIIEQIWNGRIVTEATISTCVKSARQAIGDDGKSQRLIRTVHGRGFRFVGDVAINHGGAIPHSEDASLPSAAEPTLVILPFQVIGDEAPLSPIADGLVGNLTTILTRIPLLSLISRSASFALRNTAISIPNVRERFGASYMLEGSVQQFAEGIRINLQLVDTKKSCHLWAQHFDQPHDENVVIDLLNVILPRLETQLVRAVFNDLKGRTGDVSSQQLLIQAIGILALKGWHAASFTEAAELLRRSIALQSEFAMAHAYLALILALGHRVGLMDKSANVVREAVAEAEIALQLDNMDSNVLGLAGCALADVGQPDRAIPLLKKAVEINPNNAQAWTALGSAYLLKSCLPEAIDHLNHGIKISPMDSRLAVWGSLLSLAYLQAGKLDQALIAAQNACENDDKTYLPRVVLAAVCAARNQVDEAAAALKECYRVKPDLTGQEIARLIGMKLGKALQELRELSNRSEE